MPNFERLLRYILLVGAAYFIFLYLVTGDFYGLLGIAILFVFVGIVQGIPLLAAMGILEVAKRVREKDHEPPPVLDNGKYRARFKPFLRWSAPIFLCLMMGYPLIAGSIPAFVEQFREFSWSIVWWNGMAFKVWFSALLLYMMLIGIEAFAFQLCYDGKHLSVRSVVDGSKTLCWEDLETISWARFRGRQVLTFHSSEKAFVPKNIEGYEHLMAHAEHYLPDA